MPNDSVNHSMVSVHYYDPPGFTLLEKDADWGKAAYTWGTPADVAKVKADMLKVKQRFIDQGVPVVLGEFGCSSKKDPAQHAQVPHHRLRGSLFAGHRPDAVGHRRDL